MSSPRGFPVLLTLLAFLTHVALLSAQQTPRRLPPTSASAPSPEFPQIAIAPSAPADPASPKAVSSEAVSSEAVSSEAVSGEAVSGETVASETVASETVASETVASEVIRTPPGEIAFHDPWYSPGAWYDSEIWSGSLEVGLNGTEGNSQTVSMRTGATLESKTDYRELLIYLNYARTSANSMETQHNAILKIDHSWLFAESPWTAFAKAGLAYDEFKPFDLRLNMSGGLGYRILDTDSTTVTGRFGAGVSHEFGGPDDSWVPEAVFGFDVEHQLSKRQKFISKFDYYPDWTDFRDYRLELDMGWELLIDEEANLSLKLSLIDRYDSTPNGAKNNDVDYALLLLWKL